MVKAVIPMTFDSGSKEDCINNLKPNSINLTSNVSVYPLALRTIYDYTGKYNIKRCCYFLSPKEYIRDYCYVTELCL